MPKKIINQNEPKRKEAGLLGRLGPKKTALVIVGGLLLAFGAGTGLVLLQRQLAENGGDTAEQIDSRSDVNRRPEGAVEESIAKAADGDYEGAQRQLEDELATTDDNRKAHQLLVQQAVNAYNKKDYAASLGFAEKAIDKLNDYQANSIAAQAAKATGENATAKKHYTAMLEKLDKNSPLYEDEKQKIEASIKRVSQ
ncbi:MAG: hypothetical protein ACREQV_14205 [Candidatus Binatia bacterium]